MSAAAAAAAPAGSASSTPSIPYLEDVSIISVGPNPDDVVTDAIEFDKKNSGSKSPCFFIKPKGMQYGFATFCMRTKSRVAWSARPAVEDVKKGRAAFNAKGARCSFEQSISPETGGDALRALHAMQMTGVYAAFENKHAWFPKPMAARMTDVSHAAMQFGRGMMLTEGTTAADGTQYDPTFKSKWVGWNPWILDAEISVSANDKEYVSKVTWAERVVGGSYMDYEKNELVADPGPLTARDTTVCLFIGYKEDGEPNFVRQVPVLKDGKPVIGADGKKVRRWLGPQDVTRGTEIMYNVFTPSKGYYGTGAGIVTIQNTVFIVPRAKREVAQLTNVSIQDYVDTVDYDAAEGEDVSPAKEEPVTHAEEGAGAAAAAAVDPLLPSAEAAELDALLSGVAAPPCVDAGAPAGSALDALIQTTDAVERAPTRSGNKRGRGARGGADAAAVDEVTAAPPSPKRTAGSADL